MEARLHIPNWRFTRNGAPTLARSAHLGVIDIELGFLQRARLAQLLVRAAAGPVSGDLLSRLFRKSRIKLRFLHMI